jgi:hypothetical protein
MKRRICAALLVVLVSAFSFASGTAQTASTGTSSALMTNYQVTTVGSTNWASSLTAPAGTTTSWLLSYHNMGTTNVGKLIISSSLVANQTLVPGSVMWFDGNFPNGYKLSDTGLFDAGVDVGGVAVGTNGFIRYRTQSVETTPCGITSESAGYFDADGVKSSYKATYATPACIETATAPVAPATATPTATSTDVTAPTTTSHDHTVATATTPTVATSINPQTSATPPLATGGIVTAAATPVDATTAPSTTGTVHEAHALTTVSLTTTEATSPATPAATSTPSPLEAIPSVDTSHADHSTTTTQSTTAIPAVVAQGTPTVATTTADTSAHASHTVAATPTAANSTAQVAGTSTETTAHADHTTTTPAPTAATNQSTEHSGHTIPAAGGNPLWLMSGALALGYIGKLLLLKRKMRAQPVILYWQ